MDDAREEDRVFAKISARLVPLMGVLYFVCFLDRTNIGFAALTMNKDLGFTPTVFGWGAGIFFFGYFLFEVPSNVALEKVGARIWIFRIMITWGVVATAMAFVRGSVSFYVLRFLLGAAEAGFFPGMILYLTYWFPAERRVKFTAWFMVAIPVSSAIGAPISSLLLELNGTLGLAGWQWLFIVEGLPACILGLVVLFVLPDGPAGARWLSDAEKRVVADLLRRERARSAHWPIQRELWPALVDRRVLAASAVYLGIVIGLYGIGFWLPQVVKGMGFSNLEVGPIVALPYLASIVVMIVWGRHSDRTGERPWHVALPTLLGAAGFIGSVYLHFYILALCALGVATVGIYAALAPFWSVPPLFLSGTAAAGGIALVNSIGNLGGFFGPYLVGWIKSATQSFDAGMVVLGCAMVAAALVVLALGRGLKPHGAAAPARAA